MAKKGKLSMVNLIVLGLLVVCLVLAIAGLSVDNWTDVKVSDDIKDSMFGDMADSMTEDMGMSFGDILDTVTADEFKESMDYYKQLIDEAEKQGWKVTLSTS